MRLEFTKMQGCGNDYIYLDCLQTMVEQPQQLAIQLSDRHFGIGADGLICICKSQQADAYMRMFNSDGSEGGMCGNGVRCVAQWLYERGLAGEEIRVEAAGGIKVLRRQGEGLWQVDMGLAVLDPCQIPVEGFGTEPVLGATLMVEGTAWTVSCVSMGNPHCVTFVDQDLAQLELEKIGPCFESHPAFPQRVNTEFVRQVADHHLAMRVWERGSGETLACGTGACAVGVAAVMQGICQADRDIRVDLLGGSLTIRVEQSGRVWMTGPAQTVFEGSITV